MDFPLNSIFVVVPLALSVCVEYIHIPLYSLPLYCVVDMCDSMPLIPVVGMNHRTEQVGGSEHCCMVYTGQMVPHSTDILNVKL